jgi:SOS-response transcriptional repressor LexA
LKNSVGATLAELRKEKKLKQKDVADRLANYGINISNKAVHSWEKGLTQPNADQFLALCDVLDVEDVLWQFGKTHKGLYARLNSDGRQKAREYINLLFENERFRDEPAEIIELPRLYRLYDIPVSAGSGNFIEESGYEEIRAPSYVPESVDFALRVTGDSMEPLLQDGQVIWIKTQNILNNGEIGIFTYDSEVYCKELVQVGESALLRSLNAKYKDIEIHEDFGFKVIGKVVS